MKRATREEWKEIGNQSKRCRDELHKLLLMCNDKMPIRTADGVRSAIKHLNRFRCIAEDRMLATHPPMKDKSDLRVFYGELEE